MAKGEDIKQYRGAKSFKAKSVEVFVPIFANRTRVFNPRDSEELLCGQLKKFCSAGLPCCFALLVTQNTGDSAEDVCSCSPLIVHSSVSGLFDLRGFGQE
jgi:hypothetical protein